MNSKIQKDIKEATAVTNKKTNAHSKDLVSGLYFIFALQSSFKRSLIV